MFADWEREDREAEARERRNENLLNLAYWFGVSCMMVGLIRLLILSA